MMKLLALVALILTSLVALATGPKDSTTMDLSRALSLYSSDYTLDYSLDYSLDYDMDFESFKFEPLVQMPDDPTEWSLSYAWSLKKDKYGLLAYKAGTGSTDFPFFGRTSFDVNLVAGLSVLTQRTMVGAGVSIKYVKDMFFATFGAAILTPSGTTDDMWKGADFILSGGVGITVRT